MAEDNLSVENKIKVNTGSYVGSQYSQLVGISVTDTDITIEFVFVNPRPNLNGEKDGQVVSRVTLPVSASLVLANAIQETVNKHLKKRSGKKQ